MQVKAFQAGTRAARSRVTTRQIRVRSRVLHSWACDAHRVRIFAARTLLVLVLRTHFTDHACIVRVQVVSVFTFQTELVTVPRTIRALRMLPVLAAADAKRAYVRRR